MADRLGPNEGINALQHPDCRACKERERLNLGIMAENQALKGALATTNSRTVREALDKAVMKLVAAIAIDDAEGKKAAQSEAADLINSVRGALPSTQPKDDRQRGGGAG